MSGKKKEVKKVVKLESDGAKCGGTNLNMGSVVTNHTLLSCTYWK